MMPHIRTLLVATALLLSGGPVLAQSEARQSPSTDAALVTLPARTLGREDAPGRIELYSAFNCVACATWYLDILPEVKARYIDTGEARLTFHDVAVEPIQHSVKAAMIGLCVDPARFFDVAETFMRGQAAAAEDQSKIDQWYADAIAAGGRDADEIQTCAASEATYDMVVAQNADPFAQNMSVLPGIVVNGRVLRDRTLEGVAAALAAAPESGSD